MTIMGYLPELFRLTELIAKPDREPPEESDNAGNQNKQVYAT